MQENLEKVIIYDLEKTNQVSKVINKITFPPLPSLLLTVQMHCLQLTNVLFAFFDEKILWFVSMLCFVSSKYEHTYSFLKVS